MRVSQDEKDRSRQRIIAGAARLIRERGIDATSLADVMREAGLTHGGFYRHFADKDALIEAALDAAFAERLTSLESRLAQAAAPAAVAAYHREYLQEGHVEARALGCPVPALAGDVARQSRALRESYGAHLRRIVETLARGMPGSAEERLVAATRDLAMIAGAIMLARASDPDTARSILAACRDAPAG